MKKSIKLIPKHQSTSPIKYHPIQGLLRYGPVVEGNTTVTDDTGAYGDPVLDEVVVRPKKQYPYKSAFDGKFAAQLLGLIINAPFKASDDILHFTHVTKANPVQQTAGTVGSVLSPSRWIGTATSVAKGDIKWPWDSDNPGFFGDENDLIFDLGTGLAVGKSLASKTAGKAVTNGADKLEILRKPQDRGFSPNVKSLFDKKISDLSPDELSILFDEAKRKSYDYYHSKEFIEKAKSQLGWSDKELNKFWRELLSIEKVISPKIKMEDLGETYGQLEVTKTPSKITSGTVILNKNKVIDENLLNTIIHEFGGHGLTGSMSGHEHLGYPKIKLYLLHSARLLPETLYDRFARVVNAGKYNLFNKIRKENAWVDHIISDPDNVSLYRDYSEYVMDPSETQARKVVSKVNDYLRYGQNIDRGNNFDLLRFVYGDKATKNYLSKAFSLMLPTYLLYNNNNK